MANDYDVIIIGAGPAGASAAILLAQAGWSVAMVEKQPFPRRKVCGECIAAPNLALIDALGIGDAFRQLAGPELCEFALMSGDRTIHAGLPAMHQGQYRWGRALGREHLDTLLLERARAVGADIWQPWTVRAIGGSAGQFWCELAAVDSVESKKLTASVMIAAHGSWELAPVARHEPRAPHRPSDLFAFKANFRQGNLRAGLLPVLGFPGGYGGMVLGDHGLTTIACCIRRDRLSACRQQFGSHTAAEAVEAYLKASCLGVRNALADSERERAWLSTGPIRPGIRIRQPSDVFLIGNAAGEAHPIVGEGISMAMQSAWLLCEKLITSRRALPMDKTYQAIRCEYTEQWLNNFAPRIRLAALFAHIAMRPLLLSRMLPMLQRWPELLTHAAKWSAKARPLPTDKLIHWNEPASIRK